jgi:hypothetical protein
MPLQVVRDCSESGMENGRIHLSLRFWVKVDSAEVDEVTRWQTLAFPLALNPAPPLRRPWLPDA